MWVRTYSQIFLELKKEAVWNCWTQINRWPEWHDDLESCVLHGPFAVGSYFMLKPKSMRAVKIELIDVKPGISFTDRTRFFGAKMLDTHLMEETPEGLKLTNHLIVTGPLAWLWVKLVARHVADTTPQELAALAERAKNL